MASVNAPTTLTSELFHALPCLRENPTDSVLTAALLQYCQDEDLVSAADLLLRLMVDQPHVQRRMTRSVENTHRHVPLPQPGDLQNFTDKVLQALCDRHVSQLSENSGAAGRSVRARGSGFSSVSVSVSDMLATAAAWGNDSVKLEGLAPLQPTNRKVHFFPTGCSLVDRLLAGTPSNATGGALEGGFCAGLLTEVHGEAGSGKTQLVLQCLFQCVARQQCALYAVNHLPELLISSGDGVGDNTFIDSLRGFATEKVAALYIVSEGVPASRLGPLATGALHRAKAMVLAAASRQPSIDVELLKARLDEFVTERTVVAGVGIRPVDGVGALLRLLSDGTLSSAFSSLGNVGVVVVDSIADVVAGGSSGEEMNRWEISTTVASVGSLLKSFAVKEGAAVVVTNQVRTSLSVSGEGMIRRHTPVPALGMQWAVAPHVRVNLRRPQNTANASRRQFTIICGPAHQPAYCSYLICNEGICNDE